MDQFSKHLSVGVQGDNTLRVAPCTPTLLLQQDPLLKRKGINNFFFHPFPGELFQRLCIIGQLCMIFFCQFLCPMGAIFAIMPIAPSALFNRDSGTCPAKCGACKKRCPAHLDIDGDTPLSGECICCHACQGICPKRNIRIGIPKAKDESLF